MRGLQIDDMEMVGGWVPTTKTKNLENNLGIVCIDKQK